MHATQFLTLSKKVLDLKGIYVNLKSIYELRLSQFVWDSALTLVNIRELPYNFYMLLMITVE